MTRALALSLAAAVLPASRSEAGERPDRTLELVETVRINPPAGAKRIRVWIPRLASDRYQTAELLEVRSPWRYRVTRDLDFGNELIFAEGRARASGPAEISARYRLRRLEQSGPDNDPSPVPEVFTRPRGLLTVDDEVRRIARETTDGLSDPMLKARALYHYVLTHMDYDTTGQGWGRGDVRYACAVGKGNCTDFHSLFIALSLAEGIPARFRMGYPVPGGAEGTVAKPYHCWAEFHVDGRGWIPVDISEAWKHPAKADYYFGNLDADRVMVSTGRHIRLQPPQQGQELNYLARPYAEADGKPVLDLEFQRRYKDVSAKPD